jgi:HSP20 family protein
MTWLPVLRTRGESNVMTLKDEMDRLFNSFFDEWPVASMSNRDNGLWAPAVDIQETDTEYLLKAEVPGMDVKDVDVSLADNVLTLRGEKKVEKEEKKKNYHHVECHYGSFHRTFQLPPNADEKNVKAECSKGVLTVNIPKSPETKPKKIEIKGE